MLTLCLTALLAASPELEEGRVAFSRLKYAQAVASLKKAAADTTAPTAERIEALDLLARSELALGSAAHAKAAYEQLLALDPMANEPAASPKIRAAFKAAKEARFAPKHLVVTRRPTAPEVLEAELVNPWRLAVRAELWEATSGDFAKRELTVDGHRVLAVLGPGTRSYLRVVGEDGVVLATLGSANEPIAGPPPLPPPAVVEVKPGPKTEDAKAADAPLARPALTPTATATTTTSPAPPTTTGWPTRKALGLAGVLVGAAAIVTGIVLLAVGTGIDTSVNASCFPFCEEGRGLQTAGALVGVFGLLVGAGGAYLLLQPDSRELGQPLRL